MRKGTLKILYKFKTNNILYIQIIKPKINFNQKNHY